MNYLDLIISVCVLYAVFSGLRQGFIRPFFGLLALLLGVFCAYKFSYVAAECIARLTTAGAQIVNAAAFAVTFIAVLVGVYFAGAAADKIISMVALAWLNRLLGVAMSLFKTVLILGVCTVILNTFHAVPAADIEQSLLYRPIQNFGLVIFPYLAKLWLMVNS